MPRQLFFCKSKFDDSWCQGNVNVLCSEESMQFAWATLASITLSRLRNHAAVAPFSKIRFVWNRHVTYSHQWSTSRSNSVRDFGAISSKIMLDTLPPEIVEHILLLAMSPRMSCNVAQTCHYLHTIVAGMLAWESFYYARWLKAIPAVDDRQEANPSTTDDRRTRGEQWKELFKWRIVLERNIDTSLREMYCQCTRIP